MQSRDHTEWLLFSYSLPYLPFYIIILIIYLGPGTVRNWKGPNYKHKKINPPAVPPKGGKALK